MLVSPYYLCDSTDMVADPFSDILKLSNAQTAISGGFTAEEPWAVHFPAPEKIKFFAIVKGHCWLQLDGASDPIRVETGDVIVLCAQREFVLSSDLITETIEARNLFTGNLDMIGRLCRS
ncbi:AraC family transcriptional regulator [bacterium]|nr:MAG: AraC family transcriptional regulator [bacterium]